MNLVLFCHPGFAASQSMPRFAGMLKSAFEARGHAVTLWSPQARLYKLFAGSRLVKWAGYVDQYVIFPAQVRRRLRRMPVDCLFVFCDQALGPWVPLVEDRPAVVHVHDLLALRSALRDIPENPTSFTGRLYQRYIRRGFRHARHFISISEKSRADLHRFGGVTPASSEVVYNGLNYPYSPLAEDVALRILREAGLPADADGMLLHVGGGQWYKNRPGLIAWYGEYARRVERPLPLWCVGPKPNAAIQTALAALPKNANVRFFQNLDSRSLQAAYSYARVFLFPSLAEGFGWPIVEAMNCGCPVVTTGEAPMSEVGGDAAYFVPRLRKGDDITAWSSHAADVLQTVLALSPIERVQLAERERRWASRFDADRAIDGYLAIYQRVLVADEPRVLLGGLVKERRA